MRYEQHLGDKKELQSIHTIDTHLPVIEINTFNKKIPGTPIKTETTKYELSDEGEEYVKSEITFYSDSKNFSSNSAKIRYRGKSSRNFEKKSYSLNLIDEKENSLDVSLFGMDADNSWVLHGPSLDKTLIRNYLAMNLSGKLMPFSPDVRFVELFVNREYQGVYLLMEKVSKGEGRVPIKTPGYNDTEVGYLVEINRLSDIENNLNDHSMDTFKLFSTGTELKYPTKEKLTRERLNYIDKKYSDIVYSIYQSTSISENKKYKNEIDIQAFQDYFIINELFRNVDAGYYSTYFYQALGGRLTPVVWDFNNSLDNYQSDSFEVSGFTLQNSIFFEQLLRNPDFTKSLINRYFYLRKSIISDKELVGSINETVSFLGEAIIRNNERWKMNYQYDPITISIENFLLPLDRNYLNYEDSLKQMKNFLLMRASWLDKHIYTLLQYSHHSRNNHWIIK